jgi:hypothetical protein
VSEAELAQLGQLGISQTDLAILQDVTTGLLALTLVSAVLTLWLAKRKRLKMGFWIMMVLLFGPLALLAIFFVPAKAPTQEGQS